MRRHTEQFEAWLFRGLMFEAEAQSFRDAGIKIGADARTIEASLLEEVLSPFPVSMRNDALRMSRLYALLYCFENSVRALIKERLQDRFGTNWLDKLPAKVKSTAESRLRDAEKNSWLDLSNPDLLGFADFGNLSDIIINHWEVFSDLIPSQHWIKQRMEELEKVRNFLAHNRTVADADFQRIEMYVRDWNRQVGL